MIKWINILKFFKHHIYSYYKITWYFALYYIHWQFLFTYRHYSNLLTIYWIVIFFFFFFNIGHPLCIFNSNLQIHNLICDKLYYYCLLHKEVWNMKFLNLTVPANRNVSCFSYHASMNITVTGTFTLITIIFAVKNTFLLLIQLIIVKGDETVISNLV